MLIWIVTVPSDERAEQEEKWLDVENYKVRSTAMGYA